MGSTKDLPNHKTFEYTDKYVPFPPPSFLVSQEGVNYHQRCSSESFLIDEQPSWLDDLLDDTETVFHRGHHRRSASDSCAYLENAAETFTLEEESKYVNSFFGWSSRSQNLTHFNDADGVTYNESKESEEVLAVDHSREECSSQNLEDWADKASGGSRVRPPESKPDPKRSKQHNAHRSRVRKLQYIAHLERAVQILKAEGSEGSAELEFIEQQNVILAMENRALRQRLECVSQEQIIKHWEQGMLEREIGRLQNLYHMQKQQQMQMQMQMQNQQQQHNQHPKHRRNRSKDLDHQINAAPVKNKDATSTKGSPVSGTFRV